jgi:predicted O-linked N-acetylglucosamine transferase (SPINDLY family)
VSAADKEFQKAKSALDSGKPLEAEALFGKALALKPDLAEAWLGRGNALAAMQRFDEAVASFQKAVALKPGLAGAWLGHLLSNLRRFEEALAAYDKALALGPRSVESWLGRCHSLVQLGRYGEALAAHDKSLAIEPGSAAAWLGHLLASLGRYDESLVAYDRVLAVKPDLTEAWLGRGNTLFRLGRLGDALAAFDKVLARKPDLAEAWLGRGNSLTELGRHDDAIAAYVRTLTIKPDLAEAWLGRGNLFVKLARFDEALSAYDKALALKPDLLQAWLGRCKTFTELERYDEALAACEKALALKPDLPEAWVDRGIVFLKLERLDEAMSAFDRAVSLNQDMAEAWLGRGNVFFQREHRQEALAAYDKALASRPDLAEAWIGRGNIFFSLERFDDALAAHDRALALAPDQAEAWLGRGNALAERERYHEALAAYDKSLALKPALAEAWLGRGNLLAVMGRPGEALACYDRAMELKPDLVALEGFRLRLKMNICSWDNFDSDCNRLIESVREKKLNTDPFSLIAVPSVRKDQLSCTEQWVGRLHPPVIPPIRNGEIYRHDKIRIAYLSADLRQHPVAYLIAGVFECHDRSRFELSAISIGPNDQSELRHRLERSCDTFIDAATLNSEDIAKAIRDAETDILIDLNGFTKYARTGILARRPAPIQVNYLGFPGTMGASYIDYIVADPVVIPHSHRQDYSEKVAYLPYSYMPHDARNRTISDRVFQRDECGLREGGFVFCCFNNPYKLNPHFFRIWMRLLRAVEGSVLWLSEGNQQALENLRKEAVNEGVAPARLVFAKRLPNAGDHLARHRLADLFLDTLPFNAHTTASDALWAGLPVLTQIGETFAGRVAASLLNAVGLPELITHSSEEYENRAIELATHPEALKALKEKLGENRLVRPLFDTGLFTRHIEAAYSTMYERYQAGLAPDTIVVPDRGQA